MERDNLSGTTHVDDSGKQQCHSHLLWRQLSVLRIELSYRSHHLVVHADSDNWKFLLFQHLLRHVSVGYAGEWKPELDGQRSGLQCVRQPHMDRDQAVVTAAPVCPESGTSARTARERAAASEPDKPARP